MVWSLINEYWALSHFCAISNGIGNLWISYHVPRYYNDSKSLVIAYELITKKWCELTLATVKLETVGTFGQSLHDAKMMQNERMIAVLTMFAIMISCTFSLRFIT